MASPPTQAAMTLDQVILKDHAEVRTLHSSITATTDMTEKQVLVNTMIKKITQHGDAEEELVYPLFPKYLQEGQRRADEARAAHLLIKKTFSDIDGLSVNDPSFDAKYARAYAAFDEHAQEEEADELPDIVRALSMDELARLGSKFEKIKWLLPTHPHPMAPQTPPFHTVVGLMAKPFDKMRDAFQCMKLGSRRAVARRRRG